MKLATLFLIACSAALAGCGSKAKPAAGPTTTEPGAKVAWADMDHEQREKFMEDVVMPTMKAKFVEFDAVKYADMDCGTCHISADDHQMPNPNLYKLDFSKKPEDYSAEEQKVGHFMDTVVVPEMAKLLDEEPYNMETQKGFGCLECHTVTGAK